ncbi:hypothetical protein M8P87_13655 [Pseudomonas stutzeri]|uniref:hypothetical protein n=1 Tax=Stutzerimonas stutzeri TaxID=316 RepID=UPI00210ACDF5|nr:hypothetical protein [Stutzerimonas stutzeri]MCQ4230890.1 hypothetical protein [Stutzerimonas stutzeri]
MAGLCFLFFLLIPFSYMSLLGVRIIALQVLAGFAWLVIKFYKKRKLSFYFDIDLAVLLVLCAVVGGYAFHVDYFNEFFAIATFILLLFLTVQFGPDLINTALGFYRLSVLFVAVGLVGQYLLHILSDVVVFNYELFGGGRNAYGFIWNDYSFLSLYIASSIPLFYNGRYNLQFISILLFLLIASIITSARTGPVAFLLFIVLYIFYFLFQAFATGKLKRKFFIVGTSIFFVIPALFFSIMLLTGREVTFSSSGRVEDFVIGYRYFLDDPMFGFYFDRANYNAAVSIVPHNVFIYFLYMGGLLAFAVFVCWLVSVSFVLRLSDKRIVAALVICLIGFQFIPSFFSAYYVAILVGLSVLSSRKYAVERNL